MRLLKPVVLTALLLAAAPLAAAAQSVLPISVEVRGGAGIPVGDFGGNAETGDQLGAKTGLPLGVSVGYRVVPMLDIYGGYSRDSFGCSDQGEFDSSNCDIRSKGFELGTRFSVPGIVPLAPWVRAGALFHQLEISGSEGGFSASITSKRSFGYEIGGGISLPIMPTLALTPGVRYRGYTAKFDNIFGEGSGEGDVSYVVLDVGLRFGL